MSIEEIHDAIEAELKQREVEVLNKNAISAFLSSFTDPLGSLGKIFLGRKDALDAEHIKVAQDMTLDLLVKIDTAISELEEQANEAGIHNIVSGIIEVHGKDSEEVTGVHIKKGSRATELKPGTHIKTSAEGARNVTGLKIEN